IWLKDVLRDLQDEGLLTKERKRLARVGSLAHVAVLDIFGRDADGVLLAHPTEAVGNGEPPVIAIRVSRGGGGPTPGIGDRVLAKTFPTDDATGPAYTGRVMKIFEKRTDAVLGVFRVLQDGTFRIEPVERRQPELVVDKEFQNGAKNGDLVEVEPARASRYGLPRAKVLAVLGSLTSEKAVSMIAIHAHDIPHIFPADVIAEAEAVKPATVAGREDWRDLPLITIDPADAKDHDDAVFATADPDEKNPGGVVVTVAIADVAAYVRYGTALDREALKRGN
ncbi:MAG: RNB domain-containing ribonuclease, partial [Mesorhizobium sp.]